MLNPTPVIIHKESTELNVGSKQMELIEKIIKIRVIVESESMEGAFYLVECEDNKWTCTCPDATKRNRDCKHIQQAKQEYA